MYCTECGTKTPDNSKFCSHCGHEQTGGESSIKEKIVEVIIEKEISRPIIESHNSPMDFKFLKKAMGFYLAWILFHLSMLLIFSNGAFNSANSNDGIKDFWPFDKTPSYYSFGYKYDISEFLVYTIFPLVILIIISLTRDQNKEKNKTED